MSESLTSKPELSEVRDLESEARELRAELSAARELLRRCVTEGYSRHEINCFLSGQEFQRTALPTVDDLDARRYRWLRSHIAGTIVDRLCRGDMDWRGERMDQLIDVHLPAVTTGECDHDLMKMDNGWSHCSKCRQQIEHTAVTKERSHPAIFGADSSPTDEKRADRLCPPDEREDPCHPAFIAPLAETKVDRPCVWREGCTNPERCKTMTHCGAFGNSPTRNEGCLGDGVPCASDGSGGCTACDDNKGNYRAASETSATKGIDESTWNCGTREQRNTWAENAGLLRVSSFVRLLPPWHDLPDEWKRRLSESENARL